MKTGKRLYIDITNRCNTDCPFCCMYSGTGNKRDMDFETYKRIIDGCGRKFELQLEGGEPLLHPDLYLFMEYARSTGRCRKMLILTNGILLEEHIKPLVMFTNRYNIPIEIKVSINYWLIKPVIRQNIEEFELFASDGMSFGMDLIARSEHKKEVQD